MVNSNRLKITPINVYRHGSVSVTHYNSLKPLTIQ